MNNVSEKWGLIRGFVIGVLLFLIWIMVIFTTVFGYREFLFSFIFVLLILWWSNFFSYLHVADISIDEINGTITIRTLFDEKIIPLQNMELKGHDGCPKRIAFILYTNSKKIVVNYTKANYDVILQLFEIKKYKGSEHFKAEVAIRGGSVTR